MWCESVSTPRGCYESYGEGVIGNLVEALLVGALPSLSLSKILELKITSVIPLSYADLQPCQPEDKLRWQ
jgi:hypothetical protein